MDRKELARKVMSSPVHQLRSGFTHRFIDITMVAVGERIFVRPYQFGRNGWYDAFMGTPDGEMKIGNEIIKIEGRIPEDLQDINPKVTQVYHDLLPGIYADMRKTYDTDKHERMTLELIVK